MNQARRIEISHEFAEFRDGVRVLMLIDRGVMNADKGSRRWINKIVTTNVEQWERALEKLLHLQYYLNEPSIRLYASVNDRKMEQAIRHFQHKQLDMVTDDERFAFYRDINNRWCSSLMQPANRNSRLFLLDVDTKDENYIKVVAENLRQRDGVTFKKIYATPNGAHWVTEGFDVRLVENIPSVEVKKDGLLLLNVLGFDE